MSEVSEISEDDLHKAIATGDLSTLDQQFPAYLTNNRNNFDKINNFNNILLNVYHNYKIKRRPLLQPINDSLLKYIVKSQFILNSLNKCEKVENKDIFIYFEEVKIKIIKLIDNILDIDEVNLTFLQLCSLVVNRVNTAKRLCKAVIKSKVPLFKFDTSFFSLILPWEQIQFILTIFNLSYNDCQSDNVFYLCVLTKDKIIKHLKDFLNEFKVFNLKEIDLKEVNNTFDDLFTDFWLVKNIYSLKMIKDCIDTALSVNFEEDKDYADMTIDRCLCNIGEFTKSTPEAPNLSQDCKMFINECSPKDVQQIIKKIRNNLAHLSNEIESELNKKEIYSQIQNDIKKMSTCIEYLLQREKYKIIILFSQNIIKLDSILEINNYYDESIVDSFINEVNNFINNFDKNDYHTLYDKMEEFKNSIKSKHIQRLYYLMEYRHNMTKETDLTKDMSEQIFQESRTIANDLLQRNEIISEWSKEELNALLEIETTILLHQYKVGLFKFNLFGFVMHLNHLKFAGEDKTYLNKLKICCLKLQDFPSYNIQLSGFLKDNILELCRMSCRSEVVSDIIYFYRDDKYNSKILEGIKNINVTSKIVNKNESYLFTQFEVTELVDKIVDLTDNDQIKDKVKLEKDKYDKIIEMFKIIKELQNLINKIENNNIKVNSELKEGLKEDINCSAQGSSNKEDINQGKGEANFIQENFCKKDQMALIEKTQRLIQLIKNEERTELDDKMLQALEKNKYKECQDFMTNKYKGSRKCKYEKIIFGFKKEENDNFKNKIKILKDFFNKIECNVSEEIITNVVTHKHKKGMEKKYELLNTLINYDEFETNKLKYGFEMILLNIIEQAHKLMGEELTNAIYSMRPDLLIKCGKSLRNYLAHSNISNKLLLLNPDDILFHMINEINEIGLENVPKQNYYLPQNKDDYNCLIEDYFEEKTITLVKLQDKIFKSILKDDINDLINLINEGADPLSLNIRNTTALQFAVENSSIQTLQYLITKYKPIYVKFNNLRSKILNYTLIDINKNQTPHIIINNYKELIKLIINTTQFTDFQNDDINKNINNVYNYLIENFHVLNDKNIMKFEVVDLCHIGICLNYLIDDNLESTDIFENNVLHWASSLNNSSLCQLILSKERIFFNKNTDGYTPLDLALNNNNWEIIDIFVKINNKINFDNNLSLTKIPKLNEKYKMELKDLFNNNSFYVLEFCYLLFSCDSVSSLSLLDILLKSKNTGIIDFKIIKTKLLNEKMFQKISISFIFSVSCLLNRVDIVEMIVENLSGFDIFPLSNIDNHIDIGYNLNDDDFDNDGIAVFLRQVEKRNIPVTEIDYSVIIKLFYLLTPFHLACLGSSSDCIKYMINKGINIDLHDDEYNIYPIHVSNYEVLQILIAKGCDLNQQTKSGFAPIHIASMFGNEKMVNYLINNKVNETLQTNYYLNTPSHFASERGFTNIVKILPATDLQNRLGNTPLNLATINNHENTVRVLLDRGSRVSCTNNKSMTALHCAVLSGNLATSKKIIDCIPKEDKARIINMSLKNNDGINNLVKISTDKRAYNELLREFLAISAIEYGSNVTHIAAAYGYKDIVNLLLKNNADIDSLSEDNDTPLQLAIKGGHKDVVQILLSNNASINIPDKNMMYPLNKAAYYNQPDICTMILDYSKNPIEEIVDRTNNAYSPLHIASGKGFYDVVRVLVERGADVNFKDIKYKHSALHLASDYPGYENIVQYLIEKGANVNAFTESYNFLSAKTPLHEALSSCKVNTMAKPIHPPILRIMKILIDNGAYTDILSGNIYSAETMLSSTLSTTIEATKNFLNFTQDISKPISSKIWIKNQSAFKCQSFPLYDESFEKSNFNKCRRYLIEPKRRKYSLPEDVLRFIELNMKKSKVVHTVDWRGKTSLHIAAGRGFKWGKDQVELLLSSGADINSQTFLGKTPLYIAVKKKEIDMVVYLLNNQADKNITCYRGLSPLAVAIMQKHEELIKILKN